MRWQRPESNGPEMISRRRLVDILESARTQGVSLPLPSPTSPLVEQKWKSILDAYGVDVRSQGAIHRNVIHQNQSIC